MDGYVCSDTDTSVSYPRGPEKNSDRPFFPLSLLVVVTHQDWDTNTLNHCQKPLQQQAVKSGVGSVFPRPSRSQAPRLIIKRGLTTPETKFCVNLSSPYMRLYSSRRFKRFLPLYFWRRWVCTACGLSLVASGATPPCAQASHCGGLSYCRAPALGRQAW